MKKTIVLLTAISFLIGCYNVENRSAKNIKPKNKYVKPKKKTEPFKTSLANVVGDWYMTATNRNPKFYNKIFLDGGYYTFFSDKTVIKYNPLPNYVDKKRGTFTIDTDKNEILISIPKYKKNKFIWRQYSDGKSKYLNLKQVYIKKGSKEWRTYDKIYVGTKPQITEIDAFELKKGIKYRISKSTPLMESNNPSDPILSILERITLKENAVIEIRGRKEVDNTLWYYVSVDSKNGEYTVAGWINSIALLGQNLKEVE